MSGEDGESLKCIIAELEAKYRDYVRGSQICEQKAAKYEESWNWMPHPATAKLWDDMAYQSARQSKLAERLLIRIKRYRKRLAP